MKHFTFLLISLSICYVVSCQSKFQQSQNHPNPQEQLVETAGDSILVSYLMGMFDPATHPDFVEVPSKYRDKDQRYLRREAMEAFQKMHAAAATDGIQLVIISATRNFDVQKRIWENKWFGRTRLEGGIDAAKDIQNDVERARKILEYSSMPGTSRHHWGTDIDINSLDNEYFEQGEGLALYQWMQAHAREYGFCQPYTKLGSDRQTGYFEEKWHWTYMPLSVAFTQKAELLLTNEMISGFAGAEAAKEINIITHYVLGISPACTSEK